MPKEFCTANTEAASEISKLNMMHDIWISRTKSKTTQEKKSGLDACESALKACNQALSHNYTRND